MKNGDYFKGKFLTSEDNPHYQEIKKLTQKRLGGTFGYYSDYWYVLINDKLHHYKDEPIGGVNLITYQDYEDWVLKNTQYENTQYEVY
jgi:hypothetical protein